MFAAGTILGASINTVLNFILIPVFSSYGASVATLIGYIVMWIFGFVKLKKNITFKVNYLASFFTYGLLAVQLFISMKGSEWVIAQALLVVAIVVVNGKSIIAITVPTINKLVEKFKHH